ncbi:platelet endothelial aggregation receptor 1 [Rhagoletis pomonella]|uniref:platelet endothelial aggregation receptor 1 n=1 Tax=Rhagoletis pomonella TaxID=28610 RepID=UPI0017820989|nr:platelet endothelial aggregation receptor 1 [Rhagoletis pomonella]
MYFGPKLHNLKMRNFKHFSALLLALCIILNLNVANAQFWKLNSPTDRDLFILETKSLMASGICYKEVLGEANEPTLKMQTISYCCPGYLRITRSTAMRCEPICTEDCSNGICTAPDVCECYPGYMRAGGRCEEL